MSGIKEGGAMSGIKVDTVMGPAHWASALVNGDTSGLDVAEEKAMNRWVKNLAGWSVVDVARDSEGEPKESEFSWHYRQYGGTAEGGDVIEYVIHKIPRATRKKNATAGKSRKPAGYRCRACGAVTKRRPNACASCAGRKGAAARNRTEGMKFPRFAFHIREGGRGAKGWRVELSDGTKVPNSHTETRKAAIAHATEINERGSYYDAFDKRTVPLN